MFPVLFQFGSLIVYSYGIFVALGFALAYWFGNREAQRLGIPVDEGSRRKGARWGWWHGI